MKNIEIIKQLIIDNQQEYLDWTIKVVQDKLVAQEIYITNSELVNIINEVNTIEETPITEEV